MFAKETLLFPTKEHSNYRIPSIVATKDGTVLAFCNDRKNTVADEAAEVSLMVSCKQAGEDWSPVKPLMDISGWACNIGSAVYDEITDTVMCSFGRSPLTKSEWGNYTKEQLEEMDRQAAARAREMGIERGDFLLHSSDGGKTWTETRLCINKYTFTTEEG
ncbi:MAG: exo-alpha-sialidase, partial [Clostridia bacterium]|nr:exo-alpha-sialidase [Clostridia bacterium]